MASLEAGPQFCEILLVHRVAILHDDRGPSIVEPCNTQTTSHLKPKCVANPKAHKTKTSISTGGLCSLKVVWISFVMQANNSSDWCGTLCESKAPFSTNTRKQEAMRSLAVPKNKQCIISWTHECRDHPLRQDHSDTTWVRV